MNSSINLSSIMMGAGYLVNINDIAGPYSGIVFGLSNTIATLPGIISPNMASAITKHVKTILSFEENIVIFDVRLFFCCCWI